MPIDTFRLTNAAARKYQDHSVPAMFGPLAKATMERVSLPANASVIDVACGTGALTREIAKALPGKGVVAGVDLNDTMIDVAQNMQPETPHRMIWDVCDVCNMPFGAAEFDFAFMQQGLQFFPDKPAALVEVGRVLKPGGGLYITCWRAISPFNGALADALHRYVSPEAATKARAPFSFRDGDVIADLLTSAGFAPEPPGAIILQRQFSDLAAQILALPIEADLRAAGDDITSTVIDEVAQDLGKFDQDGTLVVPQEAHLFFATKL